ncbi:MAG TPA: ABC transporter permease [Candidatus Baltobacteraceae bacterium]|jgi:peptide/nickel transport system permease protein|nr:ABC transporter permease [Candidatus Baltobacteraceae bacterium]
MIFLKRSFRERAAVVGALIVFVIVFAAIFGPLLDRVSPIAIDHRLVGFPQPPSWAHPLGTDVLGRDEFVRTLAGARVSLFVGVTAMLIAVSMGTLYGAIAGAAGGIVDSVMMRVVDALLSFPSFFLIITVEALTNRFTLSLIVLIIGLLSWMGVARLVRAEVLSLRERDFVEAARALGASPARVVCRHLIPNALAPVVVAATLAIGDNILIEAGLSYLGLGVQIPTPSWGNMLQDALTPAVRNAPWLVLTPGLLIVGTLLGFSLVGEGLRVGFDRTLASAPNASKVAPKAA